MKAKAFRSEDVVIKWSWRDVKELRPGMSDLEAKQMLDKIFKHLEQNCIGNGWEIMETLIQMEE